MTFDHPGKTITEIAPGLYQGACPVPESDFSSYGTDALVCVLRNDSPPSALRFRGCEIAYLPLVDNPHDPVPDPLSVLGTTLEDVIALAHVASGRVRDGRPVVALCEWGYNRSGLLAGLAMRMLGHPAGEIIERMRASRGPHPMGYGPALNNPTFRAIVERGAP